MKNKLSAMLIPLVALTVFGAAISSCEAVSSQGEDDESSACLHDLVHVDANEPDCYSDGNKEYWKCLLCGKYFEDEQAITEITDITSVIFSSSGHTFVSEWSADETCHWHASDCGHADVTSEREPHIFGEWTVVSESACTGGQRTRSCTVCGYEEVETVEPTHSLYYVEAVPADCLSDGNIAYWVCGDCGKYFADGDGLTEIEDRQSVVLPATGHTFSDAWQSDDDSHWHAAVCGHDAESGREAHDYGEWTVTKPASCSEEGTAERVCLTCGHRQEKTLEKTAHEFIDGVCACGETVFEMEEDRLLGGYVVKGIKSGYECPSELAIPAVYRDKAVVAIADHAFDGCTAESAVIGGNIAFVGEYSFANSLSLTKMTVENGVVSIGFGAFAGCERLTEVKLPFIGSDREGSAASHFGYVFGAESFAENAAVPATLCRVELSDLSAVAASAFDGCAFLREIVCNDGLISVGASAFRGCASLEEMILPDSVVEIGNGAFGGCTALKRLSLPFVGSGNADEAYLGYCFGGNSYFSNATRVPPSLKRVEITGNAPIAPSAFEGCLYLEEAIVAGQGASVGDRAFYGCVSLRVVSLSEGVSYLGNYAFGECGALESLTLPDTVKTLGNAVFYQCVSLRRLDLGANLGILGNAVFSGCSSLQTLVIPDSVTYIGVSVLYGCGNLQSLTVPFVGDSVKSAYDSYQYPFGYLFGQQYYAGAEAVDQRYRASNAAVSETVVYYIPSSLRSVTVTGGNILYGAFYHCSMLEEVVLGAGVTSVGECAFEGCTGLTAVTLSESVTEILWCAFFECVNLTEIVVPENVAFIDSLAFYGCDALTVYACASAQPEAWSKNWNFGDACDVVWGHACE